MDSDQSNRSTASATNGRGYVRVGAPIVGSRERMSIRGRRTWRGPTTRSYNCNMSDTPVETIELRPNRAGRLRAFIAGTRVRVQDIYGLSELQGKTPDEIVVALPHLTLAQVHMALAYYFQNREAILREMREDDDFTAVVRTQLGPGPLAAKLQATD